MKDLTSRDVRRFWDYMMDHYRTTLIRKGDIDLSKIGDGGNFVDLLANLGGGAEMQLVALFLDKLDVIDKRTFMERYTTTLGDRIYIPFEIGDASTHSLESQVKVCVHEHQHVLQYRHEPISFVIRYLADRAQRAIFEAEAFRCNLEISWWLTEGEFTIYQAQSVAEALKNYGCSSDDIAVVKKFLRMSYKTVEAGGVINATSQVAIRWLERNVG